MATTEAGKKDLLIAQFLGALGYRLPSQPGSLRADNRGAIPLTANLEFHLCTKHIEVRYHLIQEKVEYKEISINNKSTKNMVADRLTKALDPKLFKAFWNIIEILAATRWLCEIFESVAILFLATVLVMFHVLFVPTSHLFRLWSVLYIIFSASHLFASHLLQVSSILGLTYSACHLFRIPLYVSSAPYSTYSVFQDLDYFFTLGSCLNFKPHLGINHFWQDWRGEQKDVYRENSTSCILKSFIVSETEFNRFIDEIFSWLFDKDLLKTGFLRYIRKRNWLKRFL